MAVGGRIGAWSWWEILGAGSAGGGWSRRGHRQGARGGDICSVEAGVVSQSWEGQERHPKGHQRGSGSSNFALAKSGP
jgi:hypothetical protein